MTCFHLKACPKCRGDLALDEGDWLCLQCGTYYYTGLYGQNALGPQNVLDPWALQLRLKPRSEPP